MSDSDEELDVNSERFDPLKALYSEKVTLPCPSAPIYDNLSKYTSLVIKGGTPKGPKKKNEPEASTSQPLRRFLPHQMPVPAPERARRHSRTVLTRLQLDGEGEPLAGPLAVLRDCMDRRLKLTVYTRHMNGVRGSLEGFVAAFDKHWNLALEDVREVWERRRRPRLPALGPERARQGLLAAKMRAHGGAAPPPVRSAPLPGGRERCERIVGQLLVRGEHVVLVAVRDLPPRSPPAAPAPAPVPAPGQ